jgi:hypothetical protein
MELGRPLLWCACRHHVYNLIAKGVWSSVFPEKSVCPGEKLCKDFHDWWTKADSIPRKFTAADRPKLFGKDDPFADCIADLKRLSSSLRSSGKSLQRGDYDELLELCEVIALK